jgi:hypothetical protein
MEDLTYKVVTTPFNRGASNVNRSVITANQAVDLFISFVQHGCFLGNKVYLFHGNRLVAAFGCNFNGGSF